MKTCVCAGGGGGGGERGCILKQQNLSRAMRDWDLMHEEGATLSTMCNTHTALKGATHPSYSCTYPPNEMAIVYRVWHKTTPIPPDMHTRVPPTHHPM